MKANTTQTSDFISIQSLSDDEAASMIGGAMPSMQEVHHGTSGDDMTMDRAYDLVGDGCIKGVTFGTYSY